MIRKDVSQVGRAHSGAKGLLLRGAASVAILSAFSSPALAEEEGSARSGDIIVTASRRAVDVSSIPYNISAISGEDLEKAGVTDMQSLAKQVPNLYVPSSGSRFLAAQVPIIRGLNSSSTILDATLAQKPVAVYLGNVEAGSFFPVDDVARVEVLRGPQGTLYGGGSLGGTVRIIPNEPKLGTFEGSVSGTVGIVSHSKDVDYSAGGVINLPLGETAALRVSAKYEHTAGFIDNLFKMKTEGPRTPAVLADPSDYVNSGAVYEREKDFNWSRAISARAALKFEPSANFEATLAFNYAGFKGDGGNIDRSEFTGGIPWPVDPRVTIPALGKYKTAQSTTEPYKRDSYMASLDMSLDLGFATLSSTTSYMKTEGSGWSDNLGYTTFPSPGYFYYYAGFPVFPRYIVESNRLDTTKSFVNELRLVSNDDGPIQYTIGGYIQDQKGRDTWNIYAPGANDYFSQPIYGAACPFGPFNCIGLLGDPNDRLINLTGSSRFKQQAVFGELTWSPTPELHITGGVRAFHINYKRTARNALFLFGIDDFKASKFKTSSQIFKANVSYDFAPDNMLYATFSQGYRRGGANAYPTAGFFYEIADRIPYKNDKVDNYEIGIKGRMGDWRYNLDLFDDEWKNVQIDTYSPGAAWPLVVNGDKARSRGIEIELSGPITPNLSLVFGYAYAKAELTKGFCLGAHDGFGGIDPCGYKGIKGNRLPGSPQHSGSGTLNFEMPMGDNDSIGASLNVAYKGTVVADLEKANIINTTLDDYFLVNLSANYTTGPITFGLYARNLFDKRAEFSHLKNVSPLVPNLASSSSIGTPRQVGVSAKYNF